MTSKAPFSMCLTLTLTYNCHWIDPLAHSFSWSVQFIDNKGFITLNTECRLYTLNNPLLEGSGSKFFVKTSERPNLK